MLDVGAYLKRINYSGPLEPSEQVLFDLHLAHLLAVPFENLSIHSGEQIILSDEHLFNKIVVNGRGGFCYELNGLFAALLKQLGFNVSILSAGVKNDKDDFSPDFDHMTLLVVLNERWLADVGFGDSFRKPLRIDSMQVQQDGDRLYKIAGNGSYLLMMEKRKDSEWKSMYRFKLDPYVYDDFQKMCNYHQTSPESHFTRQVICSLAKPDGRVTISSNRFLTTKDGKKEEKELTSEEEVKAVLYEHFNIRINNLKSIVN